MPRSLTSLDTTVVAPSCAPRQEDRDLTNALDETFLSSSKMVPRYFKNDNPLARRGKLDLVRSSVCMVLTCSSRSAPPTHSLSHSSHNRSPTIIPRTRRRPFQRTAQRSIYLPHHPTTLPRTHNRGHAFGHTQCGLSETRTRSDQNVSRPNSRKMWDHR